MVISEGDRKCADCPMVKGSETGCCLGVRRLHMKRPIPTANTITATPPTTPPTIAPIGVFFFEEDMVGELLISGCSKTEV